MWLMSEKMKIKLLFFARIKELTKIDKTELEIPIGSSVAELKNIVGEAYPALKSIRESILVSVNQEFMFNEDIIPDGAEVAMFPPVSGGSQNLDMISITYDELDLNKLMTEVTEVTTGAAAIFTGIIRGETKRGKEFTTVGLEYEAYKPMAEAKMTQIAKEIRAQWPAIERIVITQRIGYLDAGTPTVVIICTASHRDTGVFQAAEYGINRLKEIVPVWKKEIGPNGETWIEGSYHPKQGD